MFLNVCIQLKKLQRVWLIANCTFQEIYAWAPNKWPPPYCFSLRKTFPAVRYYVFPQQFRTIICGTRYCNTWDGRGRVWTFVFPISPLKSVVRQLCNQREIPTEIARLIWGFAESWPCPKITTTSEPTGPGDCHVPNSPEKQKGGKGVAPHRRFKKDWLNFI